MGPHSKTLAPLAESLCSHGYREGSDPSGGSQSSQPAQSHTTCLRMAGMPSADISCSYMEQGVHACRWSIAASNVPDLVSVPQQAHAYRGVKVKALKLGDHFAYRHALSGAHAAFSLASLSAVSTISPTVRSCSRASSRTHSSSSSVIRMLRVTLPLTTGASLAFG